MIEKGIRGGICQVTHRCTKANNKYMKNYDKNTESSCIKYLDANNLYGCIDLPFPPEREKVEKVEKLICSKEDKGKYVVHIRALKKH